MKAQRFRVTLSSDSVRNQAMTEIMDQGGIDYEVVQPPTDRSSSPSLPKVEADGMTLTSFNQASLRHFLVEHGAQFEDS